jgi:predicted nucleic acid-binding protein
MVGAYFDSSALTSLYLEEKPHSSIMRIFIKNYGQPIEINSFQMHEVRNAIRLNIFWKRISEENAQNTFSIIERNMNAGALVKKDFNFSEALQLADSLSQKYTPKFGIRGQDILHISIAKLWKTKQFVTFDEKQAQVAKLEGFNVITAN